MVGPRLVTQRRPRSTHHVGRANLAGGRVAGRLHWIHVACTDTWTLFHLDAKRGKTAMDADTAAILPSFTGVAVHDGLAAYRRYEQASHGLRYAHHLRELAGMAELTGQAWTAGLAELHIAVELARVAGHTTLPARRLASFRKRYDAFITDGKQLNPPPPRTGKRGRPALGPAGSLLARLEPTARMCSASRATSPSRSITTRPNVTSGWSSSNKRSVAAGAPTPAPTLSSTYGPTSAPHAKTARAP